MNITGKELLILFVLIIAVHLIYTYTYKTTPTKESFYGLKWNQQYDYIKCCEKYGCNSFNCQYFLHQSEAPLTLIGSLYSIDPNKKRYSLYNRFNIASGKYEYFYKESSINNLDTASDKSTKDQKINEPAFLQLSIPNNELFDGDKITLPTGDDVTVNLFSMDATMANNYQYFNNLQTFPRYLAFNPDYSNRIIMPSVNKVGILVPTNPSVENIPEKLLLYEQEIVPRRNSYKYFTYIGDVLVELKETNQHAWDYPGNKVHDGDEIPIPGLPIKYKFVDVSAVY